MSGLRFKVGELAVFYIPRHPCGVSGIGRIVEVVEVGPIQQGQICQSTGKPLDVGPRDYIVQMDGFRGSCDDYQLRKLDPPAEPVSLTRIASEEIPA
jgi:hypothetical protein